MAFPDGPLLLSIESSASTCGVALSAGSTLLAEMSMYVSHMHDRLLAQYCSDILGQVGRSPDQIDAVAVSAGPGSFTGLRIGAALVKALCYNDKPHLIAVPTLHALATAAEEFAQAVSASSIVAAVGSHKDLIYVQSFGVAPVAPLSDIAFTTLGALEQSIQPGAVYCGPPTALLHGIPLRLSGLNRLTPRFIARLAARMYEQGEYTPAAAFVPLYVQEFVPRTSDAV